MPELLLEVGCEELPASFVEKAAQDLKGWVRAALEEAGYEGLGEGCAMGTPRRLIVGFADVPARQPDRSEERRGPSLQAAFGEDGAPSKALLGFCRGQGIEPEALERREGYVWVRKELPGRPTGELLSETLPAAIRKLSFEKSMRWGASRMRFARPVRWLLAAYDGQAVPFEIEGVASGLKSRGHRFYAPAEFESRTFESHLQNLRAHCVEPDPEARRARILETSRAATAGTPDFDPKLVDENVYLTEWPEAVEGSFHEPFLGLPEAVLVTAMAKHERMFPVRDAAGKLTNRFLAIRNAGEPETVSRGNAWVLNARFNDAKFFFDEDARLTLEAFLEKTGGIVFSEKLGTVRQRADRLARLAGEIANWTGADADERALAEQAGRLAKADLSTGLVSELPSLQGLIGAEYAAREGNAPAVVQALRQQYGLPGEPPRTPEARTAVRLLLADQIDKLAGFLGVGLVPSGSSDPYGLRRAATILIEAAWLWEGIDRPYVEMLPLAEAAYAEQGIVLTASVCEALEEMFSSRYEALLPEARHDLLEGALAAGDRTAPRAVRFRLACLERLSGDAAFVQTANRPLNILTAARKAGERIEATGPLDSPEGVALSEALEGVSAVLGEAVRTGCVEDAAQAAKSLEGPIHTFFERTMVMAENPEVRAARLGLVERVASRLLALGDFSKVAV